MTYYLPTGSWPLDELSFTNFFNHLGYNRTDKHNANFLLLPGGSDLNTRYNRDKTEIDDYVFFKEENKPVIGICRGMQLMLHLNDGELVNHLPVITDQLIHTTITGHYTGDSSWHKTNAGIFTNSRHHQGFMKIPVDWQVIDNTSDGVIEAIRRNNEFGVQWHPELPEMLGTNANDWFIDQLEKTIK